MQHTLRTFLLASVLLPLAGQHLAADLSVVSAEDDIETYAVPTGSPVAYTITFSGDIDGSTVSADDFANAGSAPVTFGTISETAPGVLRLPLTPTGAGTLHLKIPAGAFLADAVGNALDTSADILLGDAPVPVYVASSGLPYFVGASAVALNEGSSITMEMPADTAPGDLLIACVVNYASGGTGDVTNSGTDWVFMKGKKMANENRNRIKVFHREVLEGDASTFTLGLGGTAPYSAGGIILAFRNYDKTDRNVAPFGGGGPSSITSSAESSTDAKEISAVFVNQAHSLVVLLGVAVAESPVDWSNWSFRELWNPYSIGPPEEILDRSASSGTRSFSFAAANTIFAAPEGPTGWGNATLSAPAHSAGLQFQLKPLVNDALDAALVQLKAHLTGAATLSSAEIGDHIDRIISNRGSFSSSVNVMAAAMDLVHTYENVLGPLWVAHQLPRRDSLQDDIHHAVFQVMLNLMTYTYNERNLAAHFDLLSSFSFASAAHFPGICPPPEDPDASHSVLINADYPDTWGRPVLGESPGTLAPRPTGTYLAPGTVATVTVPQSMVGRGYHVRVGAHNADLSEKNPVRRLDRCTTRFPISATTLQVANPFGGGIYIEVPPYRTGVGVVSVAVRGAVRAPYFSAKHFHQTSLEEWQNIERHHPAPWADFQSEKIMMQVPTNWIYAFDDPVTLMADWDKAADILNDFMGFPRDRGRETMYNQVDVVFKADAFAPGYPAVNNTYDPKRDYGGNHSNYLLRGPQHAAYTEFHEMGHAYLFTKFPGERESDVNLLHVPVFQSFGYSLDEAFRTSVSGAPEFANLETTAVAWMMCDNFLNGNIMEQHEKQYALKGHAKFVEIARLFGWERLGNYFKSFNEDYEKGITPANDVDSLLLRLSKRAGIDMRPLFHFWGVPPVDAAALESTIQAANLPNSGFIHDTLVRYKSLIPADNAEFQSFALGWWGREPSSGGYSEERNHASRWASYDEAMAAATVDRAQQIIDLYFPSGRPSDYGDWRSQWEWAGANLLDPNLDWDKDGMRNEDERIWGLDPTDAGSKHPIQFGSDLRRGNFSYTRRNQALTGMNFSVWTSPDLVEWTEDTGAQQLPGDPDSYGVEEVETMLSPELLEHDNLFIQLRASE